MEIVEIGKDPLGITSLLVVRDSQTGFCQHRWVMDVKSASELFAEDQPVMDDKERTLDLVFGFAFCARCGVNASDASPSR